MLNYYAVLDIGRNYDRTKLYCTKKDILSLLKVELSHVNVYCGQLTNENTIEFKGIPKNNITS